MYFVTDKNSASFDKICQLFTVSRAALIFENSSHSLAVDNQRRGL